MAKRAHDTDERKAEALAALAANGGKVAQTARQLGIHRKTLEGGAKGRSTGAGEANLRHPKSSPDTGPAFRVD